MRVVRELTDRSAFSIVDNNLGICGGENALAVNGSFRTLLLGHARWRLTRPFARLLRREITDPRLTVHAGSCTDLEVALRRAGVEHADVVVSGVPFSTMQGGDGRRTLEAARRVMGPGGRFVAYQFRSHVRRLAEPVFGHPETHGGFWNLPPMRIYVWKPEEVAA